MTTGQHKADDGISLLEMTISITILMLTLLGFQVVLTGSITSYRHSRMTTLGQQVGDDLLEKARNWPWDNLGTVGGNPPGTIPPEQDLVVGTVPFHVSTVIEDITDDSTGVPLNAREITVVVKGNGLQSVTLTTRIASPAAASKYLGVIRATVTDSCAVVGQEVVVGFPVKLSSGPSTATSPRTANTDSTGVVTFTQLLPTKLPKQAQDYYDITPADLTAYDVNDSSFVPVANIDPATWNTNVQRYLDPGDVQKNLAIKVYKRGTLVLHVMNPGPSGTEANVPGTLTVQKVVPNPSYNPNTQTGGSPTIVVTYNATNVTTTPTATLNSLTSASGTISIKPCDTYNYLFTPRGQTGTLVVNGVSNGTSVYTGTGDTSVDGAVSLPPTVKQTLTVRLGGLAVGAGVTVFATAGGPQPIPTTAPLTAVTNAAGQASFDLQYSNLDKYTFTVQAGGIVPPTTTTTVAPSTTTTVAPTTTTSIAPTTTSVLGTTTTVAPTTTTTIAPTTTTTVPLPTSWKVSTLSMIVPANATTNPAQPFDLVPGP